MTKETFLFAFLAALLGLLFNLFAVKLPSVQTRAKVANIAFSYSQYFKDDAPALISSILAIFIYLLVLKELVSWKPDLVPWIIGFSVCVGFMGTSLILAVLGQAQSNINSIVNIKTDIADAIVTGNETPKE